MCILLTIKIMMKKIYALILVSGLAVAPQSHAEGWLDSLKGLFGMTEEVEAVPKISDMTRSVSDAVGITESQATGGLASIFNYAKDNISTSQFSELSNALPGLESLLGSVPDISNVTSEGGLSSILDKAASYSDSFKSVNELNKQFEALGLEPAQIMQIVNSAKAYLDTEQGQEIKALLVEGLGKFSG